MKQVEKRDVRKKVKKILEEAYFSAILGDKTAFEKVEKQRGELLKGVYLMKTPQKFIRTRPGKAGRIFKYVPGGLVIRALHLLFGKFNFQVELVELSDQRAIVKGILQLPDGRVVEDFGAKEAVRGMSLSDMLKSASTDALKRCARLVGVFLDLWIEEEKTMIEVEESGGVEEEMTDEDVAKLWLERGRELFRKINDVSKEDLDQFIKRVEVISKNLEVSDETKQRIDQMLSVLSKAKLTKILNEKKNGQN